MNAGGWQRIAGGYQRGDAQVLDNGGGFGSARGAGRWAVEIAGEWIVNIDYLADAKARAELELKEAAR